MTEKLKYNINYKREQIFIFTDQGTDLQRIVSATYELIMTSGTYDKVTTNLQQWQRYL